MPSNNNIKVITINRKAFHDYEILERVEAGLVLTGTEIKSIRAGRANVREAYARPMGGELWLVGAHIAQYPQGGIYNHEPGRSRKILLHRNQLTQLMGAAMQKGLTITPLRLYIRNHVAKVELGLARGRRQYDKRKLLASRDAERDMQRAIRSQRY
ncbi:SsrA-binding protein SmpB [Dehalococcoidia bacterium]|nr:SsrA-binding protein SmpB [Dehalococcoidia bacterium]MCL0044005.1 SsrA-binding protein SmpB [Dehalococcoidia bacterium]